MQRMCGVLIEHSGTVTPAVLINMYLCYDEYNSGRKLIPSVKEYLIWKQYQRNEIAGS